MADDIFEYDDGIVHDDADGQHQSEEGEDVYAVSEGIKQGEGAQNRDWDGGGGNEGGTRFVKKKKDQNNNEKDGNDQRDDDFMNGVFDVKRGVERDIHVNIRGQNELYLLQFPADALGNVDGISV
jgi:hypothetical protein